MFQYQGFVIKLCNFFTYDTFSRNAVFYPWWSPYQIITRIFLLKCDRVVTQRIECCISEEKLPQVVILQ